MTGLEQIVLNRVQCKECGEILTSYHRHDYKTCKCPNETMVDGGQDYQRYGGADLDKVDTSLTIYVSDDHEQMRKSVYWGTYGKNGDQPRRWIHIADMTDDHLINCLKHMGGKIHPIIAKTMNDELQYRSKNEIHVRD